MSLIEVRNVCSELAPEYTSTAEELGLAVGSNQDGPTPIVFAVEGVGVSGWMTAIVRGRMKPGGFCVPVESARGILDNGYTLEPVESDFIDLKNEFLTATGHMVGDLAMVASNGEILPQECPVVYVYRGMARTREFLNAQKDHPIDDLSRHALATLRALLLSERRGRLSVMDPVMPQPASSWFDLSGELIVGRRVPRLAS